MGNDIINNGTMIQYFEWELPSDASLWRNVSKEAKRLEKIGITAVWLPPAYKGNDGINEVGYAVYDLYDLGEFNQKGTIPTKYGTKDEYIKAINDLHRCNIDVYGDISLDHKIGADEVEEVKVVEEDSNNRSNQISGEKYIAAWTKFDFPGRNNKYSDFKWNWTHFDGVDWDERTKKFSIYRFCGKSWDEGVDSENGNYDYLMGADIDFSNEEVVEELINWGKWYLYETNVDGFRIDAAKHICYKFMLKWLKKLREISGKELFSVAEYWHPDAGVLQRYISETEGTMSVFDVPFHYNFTNASTSNGCFDMRKITCGSLLDRDPVKTVTFVDNHDTEPGQALQSWVEGWFKQCAYSFILLRQEGYPCIFYGDLYGIEKSNIGPVPNLDLLIYVRKKYSYGKQNDYIDHPDIIGWTREGDEDHVNSGLAVLMTNAEGGNKRMYIGKQFAKCKFVDCLRHRKEVVEIDEEGYGLFFVEGGSVSVYINKLEYNSIKNKFR